MAAKARNQGTVGRDTRLAVPSSQEVRTVPGGMERTDLDPAEVYYMPTETESQKADRWKAGGGVDVGSAYSHKSGGRDTDGTIDRVRDPPLEVLPTLYQIQQQCMSYNIDLHSVFESAGGRVNGMMPHTKFSSALVVALHRCRLDEPTLAQLTSAYGCGQKAPEGSARSKYAQFDSVAWKDFCEDVDNAIDHGGVGHPYPGGPPPY